MEELLNKLIERGWRPNGEYTGPHKPYIRLYKDRRHGIQFYYNEWWDGEYRLEKVFSLRDIISKESGLWQFVCENGMLNKKRWSNRVRLETSSVGDYIEIWTGEDYGGKFDNNYEYRLIESALCDEDKLEQFLLDNIKIECLKEN